MRIEFIHSSFVAEPSRKHDLVMHIGGVLTSGAESFPRNLGIIKRSHHGPLFEINIEFFKKRRGDETAVGGRKVGDDINRSEKRIDGGVNEVR